MTYSGYCTINQIKERCLLALTDDSQNARLEAVGTEASRYIDEALRPYMSYAQSLTLAEADYVDCIGTDIGKEVMDDEVKVGKLLDYNNTTRIWKIKTTVTIADASVIKIAGGTGEGTGSGASSDDITEQESPYFIFKTLPLVDTIPAQITFITADLAAGIYIRRFMPERYSEEWWSRGIRTLIDYINQNWKKGVVKF